MAKMVLRKKKLVSYEGLSDRQNAALTKHSVHHSNKHMNMMASLMRDGKTFTEAHNMAMSKVGK
tara:strand:+ start:1121 stop:1312 length:192 start_codon:yes stop_codon:yes gene_type:complete